MDFSEALTALKEGKRIHGIEWPDGTYVARQVPDENSKMTIPYLYIHYADANMPWSPIYTDMFTDAWAVLD